MQRAWHRNLKEFLYGSKTYKRNTPIIFYHATRAKNFEVFKIDKNGCIFFSTSPQVALSFTNLNYYFKATVNEEHIYPVYLYTNKIFDTCDISCIKEITPFLSNELKNIVFSFMKKQLLDHYPSISSSVLEHLQKDEHREGLLEELRSDARVMPEALRLFSSFYNHSHEETLHLLQRQISSEAGWVFFEKVYPELITYIQSLDYDSFVTMENVNTKFDFNIAIFSPNQIKSIYNCGKFDKKSDSILD